MLIAHVGIEFIFLRTRFYRCGESETCANWKLSNQKIARAIVLIEVGASCNVLSVRLLIFLFSNK
jgi:hypothetical protein